MNNNIKKFKCEADRLRHKVFDCLCTSNEKYFTSNEDVNNYFQALNYSEANQLAQNWASSIIKNDDLDFNIVKEYFDFLVSRNATIQKAYIPYLCSKTSNLKANIFYYDYYYAMKFLNIPSDYKFNENLLTTELINKYNFDYAETGDKIIFEALLQFHTFDNNKIVFFEKKYENISLTASSISTFAIFSNSLNQFAISNYIDYFNIIFYQNNSPTLIKDFVHKVSTNYFDSSFLINLFSSESLAFIMYTYQKARLINYIFSSQSFAPLKARYSSYINDDLNLFVNVLNFKELPLNKFNSPSIKYSIKNLDFNDFVKFLVNALYDYRFEYDLNFLLNLCSVYLAEYFVFNKFDYHILINTCSKIANALQNHVINTDLAKVIFSILTTYMTDNNYENFRSKLASMQNLSDENIYNIILQFL